MNIKPLTSKTHDFDQPVNRRGSGCVKWDETEAKEAIPMWVADMDFRVAQPIIDALRQRVEHGVFGYTHVGDNYYDALCNWFSRRHSWTIDRQWVTYTSGVVPALSAVIKALTKPGDKVLLQTPVYNCFFSSVCNNGCIVEENPLLRDGLTYRIDFEDLEKKAADPQVKALVLCNPHNPVGRVWTPSEMQRVNDICLKNNVKVVADEIHCELVMPGYQYTPFASISDKCLDNSITLNSPSKSFNIAGLQIANIICNDQKTRAMVDRAININEVCDVNPLGVEGLIAAYNDSEYWIDQLCNYLHENYTLLTKHLSLHLPQVRVIKLEGTYLVWVDITALGLTSDETKKVLLKEGKVLVNSGTMYGQKTGEGFIRINIACPRSQLQEALDRMTSTLSKIKNK